MRACTLCDPRDGIVNASRTPAMLACTPDWYTATHNSAPRHRYGATAFTPRLLSMRRAPMRAIVAASATVTTLGV